MTIFAKKGGVFYSVTAVESYCCILGYLERSWRGDLATPTVTPISPKKPPPLNPCFVEWTRTGIAYHIILV